MTGCKDQGVRKWLEKQENRLILRRIAEKVDKNLRDRRIKPPTIDTQETAGSDRVQEIQSELEIFLLEREEEFQSLILSGDPKTFAILKKRFLWRLLDTSRSLQADPWRYFYRTSYAILRKRNDFHLEKRSEHKDTYMVYTMKLPSESEERLNVKEAEMIAFPSAEEVQMRKVFNAETITLLAASFWRGASAIRKKFIWVHLADFVNWVFKHISGPQVFLIDQPQSQSDNEGDGEENVEEKLDWLLHDENLHYKKNEAARPSIARSLAEKFINRLSKKEREVLYYSKYCSPGKIDWAEIARLTGHAGPSGPYYLYHIAEEKMKSFLRDTDKWRKDGFDEREWEHFIDILCLLLKKEFQQP